MNNENSFLKTRKFNFSYEVLKTKATAYVYLLQRDSEVAQNVLITPEALTQQIATLHDTGVDNLFELNRIEITNEKNILSKQIQQKIRIMQTKMQIVYAKNKYIYNSFFIKELSEKRNEKLLTILRDFIAAVTKYHAEFQAVGITLDDINELNTMYVKLGELLSAKKQADYIRDIAAQQRQHAASQLYDMLTQINNIATVIFRNTDEARYNDYILYDTVKTASQSNNTEDDLMQNAA